MKQAQQTDSVMQRDYKAPLSTRTMTPHAHWLGISLSIVALSGILFLVANNVVANNGHQSEAEKSVRAAATDTTLNTTLNTTLETTALEEIQAVALSAGLPEMRVTMPLSIPHSERAADVAPQQPVVENETNTWQTAVVKSGDSLAAIFSRLELSGQQLYRVMQAGDETDKLTRLMPGQQLQFDIDDSELQQLVVKLDDLNTLTIQRQLDGNYQVQTDTRLLETRVTNASGVIESSLFLAGQEAGLSDNLIMQLAGIFGWDVDFVLDIRSGDRFTVVYEELYLEGRKQRDGNIIAAEFINQGHTYRAFRFTAANGRTDYYSPEGNSMRKAFLRTPVDFTRISSRFGKRMHPISNTWKNHHGVDYVAPRGTPIKAAGDGKIVHIGNKGGYGKTIILQHGGRYSTLYAHMTGFKRGLRAGSRVKQGQVIGFVGTTGYSTGPHLHYEFRIDGVHRNPLTVKLPDAEPIEAQYRDEFLQESRGLVALLDVLQRTTLALNASNDAR